MSTRGKWRVERANKIMRNVRELQEKRRRECSGHEYELCYSTFGADQGAICKHCRTESSVEIYKELKIRELQKEIDRVKKL